MRFTALGFDIDHTLGIDNKLERVAFLRLLEEICDSGGRCLGTLADEIEGIDALLFAQRSGAFTIDEAVRRFSRARGAGDETLYVERYKQIALAGVEQFFVCEPAARGLLSELRARNIPHGIVSNGWSPLQQKKAYHVGFSGPILVSDELGAQKPQPEAFLALAQALGVAARELAYVGDNPATDVAGAASAGLQAIWLDAEGVRYPSTLARPARVIHSLAELLTGL